MQGEINATREEVTSHGEAEGKAVKIIDVDMTENKIILKEEALQMVLDRVPQDMPVAIIGVVGAFRTGKSFLLNLLLRYLNMTDGNTLTRDLESEDVELSWLNTGEKLEGSSSNPNDGFKWMSGIKTCTTGIWMWSKPFVRLDPATDTPMALLLMDTQGMYDMENGQQLTASIFGMASLLSSYMIFNVNKQIQEDQLQNLAMFSEYGRVAASQNTQQNEQEELKPFQKVDFLVRDFQNFITEVEEGGSFAPLIQDMENYVSGVRTANGQRDLEDVREQLDICYDEIGCYCLPHPGFDVSERTSNFDGDLSKVRTIFKRYIGDYVRRVFNSKVNVKKIHGQNVTVRKLSEIIKTYSRLFQDNEVLPEAETWFRQTQQAGIRVAKLESINHYADMMAAAGIGHRFVIEADLALAHQRALQAALFHFRDNSKSGTDEMKRQAEEELLEDIEARFDNFKNDNDLKEREERDFLDSLVRESLRVYDNKMTTAGLGEMFFPETTLETVHNEAAECSMEYFESNKTTQTESNIQEMRAGLELAISERYNNGKVANRIRGIDEQASIKSAIEGATEIHSDEMVSGGFGSSALSDDDFEQLSDNAVTASHAHYNQKEKLGSEAVIQAGFQRLESKLTKKKKLYCEQNKTKRSAETIGLFQARAHAEDLYKREMGHILNIQSPVKPPTVIAEAHGYALREALRCFDRLVTNNNASESVAEKNRLRKTLVEQLFFCQELNDIKQKSQEDEEKYRELLENSNVVKSGTGFWGSLWQSVKTATKVVTQAALSSVVGQITKGWNQPLLTH